MNNKTIGLIIVVILIVGAFILFKNQSVAPVNIEEINIDNNMPIEGSDVEEMELNETSDGETKSFVIDAVGFTFDPSSMIVEMGDTVSVTLNNNSEMPHDFILDEFSASTRVLQPGESETITFVADKSGTFEYYCSVGNHRAKGMVGEFTVR